MPVKEVNLSDLRFNLETWRRELRFHYDEMQNFQEKLEETARKDVGQDAKIGLENFQNRIMIEKAAIAKLKHRCKSKLRNANENISGLHGDANMREDMRTYIKMHYDLKEEMMDFFTYHLED